MSAPPRSLRLTASRERKLNETLADPSETPRSLPGRFVGLAALLLAVFVGLTVLRHGPIAALPDDAPADRFSAT